MKKLMTALAICAAATLSMADGSTGVTSANIVGYNTVTVPAGQSYIILGNGLRDIGSTTNSVSVQNFIPNPQAAGFSSTTAASTSDQIWFWYKNAYQTVWLYNSTGAVTSRRGKWLNQSGWDGGAANAPTTYKMPVGAGAWYKAYGAGKFTFTQTRPFTP